MLTKNNYVQVEPVKTGLISAGENEYKIVNDVLVIIDGRETVLISGNLVLIEEHNIVKVIVGGKECFFVKGENVIALLE